MEVVVAAVGNTHVLPLREFFLFFYQVGSGGGTQILRLGGKLLYQLSHFAGPPPYFFLMGSLAEY